MTHEKFCLGPFACICIELKQSQDYHAMLLANLLKDWEGQKRATLGVRKFAQQAIDLIKGGGQ